MPALLDLKGKRFNRLVVVKRNGINKHGKVKWLCKCDCGNEASVMGQHLRRGDTQSCGCLKDEQIRIPHFTHRGTHDRLYRVWAGIKQRCTNPNTKEFPLYGGRGITMCPKWFESYHEF